jgi:hypothetical protein
MIFWKGNRVVPVERKAGPPAGNEDEENLTAAALPKSYRVRRRRRP